MHGVIQLLYKYGYHLIFIILQISSFTLIINYSGKQKDIYINTSNYYASKVASLSSQVNKFIRLNVINDSLMLENANLIENLILVDYLNDTTPLARQLYEQYAIIPSNICSKTFHLNNNYLTLCKGKNQGILPDMGVVENNKGIVGVVRNVSEHYAHVMSVLNRSSKISCSIKGKTAFGTLVWNGYDPTIMHLESVPKFENVQVGDTIQTSGYSTMFPKGILVGKVQKVNVPPGSNNYEIAVHLFNNPIITQYAYVINNRFAVEQLTLESEVDQ